MFIPFNNKPRGSGAVIADRSRREKMTPEAPACVAGLAPICKVELAGVTAYGVPEIGDIMEDLGCDVLIPMTDDPVWDRIVVALKRGSFGPHG
jgi:hypothetical protein